MKLFQFFHLSDNKATGKPGQLVLVKNSLIHLKMDLNIVKPNNISCHFNIYSSGISCNLDFMTNHPHHALNHHDTPDHQRFISGYNQVS